MPTEERRLAAIMFSDICSYSKIMGEDEQRALALVGLHLQAVQQGVDLHGGRIIKEMGDGLLVEFASAVNAVKCALAVQEAITVFNLNAPDDRQMHIRIGIHLGDVVVSGSDILGDGVNVASRIEPLAEPGGICISRDILDLVENKVAIEAVHIGAKELKNISKQIDIYKVLIAAVSESGPPRKTIRHDLPLKTARRRWPLFVAAAVLFAFGLAAASIGVSRFRFRRRARMTYETVIADAKDEISRGSPEAAYRVLSSYPARFSGTSWQEKIDAKKDVVRAPWERKRVEERCRELFGFLQGDEVGDAVPYILPKQREEIGLRSLEMRLRMLAALLKLGKVTPDNLRIHGINMSPDFAKADVTVEFFKKDAFHKAGSWQKPSQPLYWRQVDGEWYLYLVKQSQSGGGRDGTSDRGGRQPARGGKRPGLRKPGNLSGRP